MRACWSVFLLFFLIAVILSRSSATQEEDFDDDWSSFEVVLRQFTPNELAENILSGEEDLAIAFHAPWCKYCKQLLPAWSAISQMLQGTDVVLGSFDCEADEEHAELCLELGVDKYPSLMFIGFGNFHQVAQRQSPIAAAFPNVVRFTADLYLEALYDWVKMLSFISSSKRRWSLFKHAIWGTRPRHRRMSIQSTS